MVIKSKSGKIINKNQKNYLDFLKLLTKWITSNNRKDSEFLELARKYNITNSTLINRITSYCYNNPHILWYINTYLNDLYAVSSYDILSLAKSLVLLLDSNNYNKTHNFFFLKSSELRDTNKTPVKNIIKQYSELIKNIYLNNSELDFYYLLFTKNIINENELQKINELINNKSKLSLSQNINSINETSKEEFKTQFNYYRTRQLPKGIQEFNKNLIDKTINNPTCAKCKLNDKKRIAIDSNIIKPGAVDFMFILLNPGKNERLYNKPVTGISGELYRRKISLLHPNTKWVIANTILCSTNNQKEIGKDKEVLQVAKFCQPFLNEIIKSFPAKYYITTGSIATKIFDIKASIVANSGEIFEINNKKIIPLVHPSAVLQYGGNNKKAFDFAFEKLRQISYALHSSKIPNIKSIEQKVLNNSINNDTMNFIKKNAQIPSHNIPQNQIIDEVTDNLTLLNISSIGNNYCVMIFIDENNIKKYKFIEAKMPVYINENKWDKCDFLSQDKLSVIYVNDYERYKLLQRIKDNFEMNRKNLTHPGNTS